MKNILKLSILSLLLCTLSAKLYAINEYGGIEFSGIDQWFPSDRKLLEKGVLHADDLLLGGPFFRQMEYPAYEGHGILKDDPLYMRLGLTDANLIFDKEMWQGLTSNSFGMCRPGTYIGTSGNYLIQRGVFNNINQLDIK